MTNANARQLILLSRYAAITLVAVVIFWLVKQDIVLSGHFFVDHDYRSPSPFFTELVPKQRVALEEEGTRFLDEPVYTTLRYPRPFKELDLNVIFQNPEDLFIEVGPQVSLPEQYELRAINHPALNTVFSESGDWEQTDEFLHQRLISDYRYTDLTQLQGALPSVNKTAYYGVDWPQPFIPAFREGMPDIDSKTPLRGSHTFFLATNRGAITVDTDLFDINLDAGADDVVFTLSDWQGNELDRVEIADDGETRERGLTSKVIHAQLSAVNLPAPAVVVFEITTTDDLILTSLKANAPYLVAKNRLHLAGGRTYVSEFGQSALRAVSVQTSARSFTVMTDDRETLQELRTARETIPLTEPFEEHRFSLPSDRRFLLDQGYTVVVEKGNVVMSGRGVFALDPNQYFSPLPWYVDQTLDVDVIGVNYVVADYHPPFKQEDGSYLASLKLNLAEVFAPTRALRVQFSLPGMHDQSSFVLQHIAAAYTSDPVTFSNTFEKLKRFIEREF